MTRVQRKIEDRSGASLSVALLFFLVCAIVGSILIAAASAAMGRMKNIEQGEQDRYAVDSAMELIAEKMGGGEVTFTASMFANNPDKRLLVQSITTGDDEDEDSGEDESEDDESDEDDEEDGLNEDGYVKGVLDDLHKPESGTWRLKIKSEDIIQKSDIRDFNTLRDYIAQTIFLHYLDKTSRNILAESNPSEESSHSGTDVLGLWNPSGDDQDILKNELDSDEADEGTTDYLYDFFFNTPDIQWNDQDIDRTEYQYISVKDNASGIEEDPIVMQVGGNKDLKVNVLIAMDTQFNISIVIYPYDEENPGLQNASIYRIVLIHCEKSNLNFDAGDDPDEVIESSNGKTTTNKYVRHAVTLNIKWEEAEKTSVIVDGSTALDKNMYFFPKQFKDLLSKKSKS